MTLPARVRLYLGPGNYVSANQGEMTFREKAAKATVSKKITRRKWSKQDFKLVAEAGFQAEA